MTLETDFKDLMEADDDLMELLPGGIYEAIQVGEISRQSTPEAFDENQEIQPCAFIRMGTETKRGPYPNSVQTPVSIYMYERGTSEDIDVAMGIVYSMFNEKRVGSGNGVWNVEYNTGSWNEFDTGLNCNLCVMRFVAVRLKTLTAPAS